MQKIEICVVPIAWIPISALSLLRKATESMSFGLRRYLAKIHQLRAKLPELLGGDLYDLHLGPTGQIQGLRRNPKLEYVSIPGAFGRLHRSERCETDGTQLSFPSFSFNLLPEDAEIFSIRIDKDSEKDGTHANPDPRCENKYGGHRLQYPTDTLLNIDHFSLLYFIALVLTYRASGEYPLCKAGLEKCNLVVNRLRKQVET